MLEPGERDRFSPILFQKDINALIKIMDKRVKGSRKFELVKAGDLSIIQRSGKHFKCYPFSSRFSTQSL